MADHRLGWISSRLYETENDLIQMQDLLMAARAQTDDWRYAHVGDLGFWFLMVARHLDATEFIRLWHADDQLAGYAILGEDPSFDCQVLPAYAWQGIEEEALEWAEQRVKELRKTDPERWGGMMVTGSRQDDAQRMAFLEQHGFHQGGQFSEVNMLCTLDGPVPEPVIPAGCQVCAVTQAAADGDRDELANRAEAQRDVWQPWTVGNVSDEDYAYFMRLPGYERELDIVAVAPDGVMAAYVNGWLDPVNKVGDFGPVGTRPAYRRQGLGRAVLLECLRRMQARGMDRVSVSTGVSNMPAIRLYEGVGFKVVNQYLEYVKTA